MSEAGTWIAVRGAAEGPLRQVDVDLPLGRLIAFVGRSGSGARTLAVEVLYAESRRRYLQALSVFERQSLGGGRRVEVEEIAGVPPALFYDGELHSSARVLDFLQVEKALGRFVRQCGLLHCPVCGGECRGFAAEAAAAEAIALLGKARTLVLAPLVFERAPGAVLEELQRAGFVRLRLEGEVLGVEELKGRSPEGMKGSLEVVVDRLVPESAGKSRLLEAIRNARAIARGRCLLVDAESGHRLWLNRQPTCRDCGRSFAEPETAPQPSLQRRTLAELERMSIEELLDFLGGISRDPEFGEALRRPLQHACALGLGYLGAAQTVDRLSEGERQRLFVASCLSRGLVGLLYIFAAPSAGLGALQLSGLAGALRRLVDQGNTVVVLDAAPPLLEEADEVWLFEAGAVSKGQGVPVAALERVRPSGPAARMLHLRGIGAAGLDFAELDLPLGRLVGIAGVSGAGKSTLLRRVLAPLLRRRTPGGNAQVEGGRGIRRVVEIARGERGKSELLAGRLGCFKDLAALYAQTPAAKQRNYPREWFLLEAPGGRCPRCEGRGVLHYDMDFLEDLSLPCPACEGRRYRPEVLEATRRGLSLGDVLEMSLAGALEHFAREKSLRLRLEPPVRYGLGHRRLGEESARLEWGEYLRLELAAELVRVCSRDLIVLDNPTGGEHPEDVRLVLRMLDEMVAREASVFVATHDPALLAAADWLVVLGPGGGREGGRIVAQGPPQQCLSQAQRRGGRPAGETP